MKQLLPLLLGIALGPALGGCRTIKADASVEGIPQACCTTADPKLENFKGCRLPQRSCKSRRGEKFWMRGDVACGPVDEAACEGGRCCTYRPQYDASIGKPIENWAPPGFTSPTNNVTDPNAKPQHDLPQPDSQSESPPGDEADAAPASSEPAKADEPAKAGEPAKADEPEPEAAAPPARGG